MAWISDFLTAQWAQLLLLSSSWGKTDGAGAIWAHPQHAVGNSRFDFKNFLSHPAHLWSANTSFSYPGSSEFEDATARWTLFGAPTYQAAIRPGSEADIARIVKLASLYKFPFLTRGAGHGYSVALAEFQNGLALDLSRWKSFEINQAAETLVIGPGVTINEVFTPLYEAGFQIQSGTCGCPSLIGVTLGGGAGRYQGVHGLVIDALISVRMITAAGDIIEVSKESHPDLFWAIRGAGANFGVVISATYKLNRLINKGNFLHADFYFAAEKSYDYFKIVESLNDNLPANLATIVLINYNASTNSIQVGGNWVYFGPEAEGMKALKPVFDLGPIASVVSVVPYDRLLATTGGGYDTLVCQGNTVRDLYSLNQKVYSASGWQKGFDKMDKFFNENPGGRNSALVFEVFPNQATAKVAPDETAFPWRDAKGYIIGHFIWGEGDAATAAAANKVGLELRDELVLTSGYDEPSVFVNYARGDEGLENVYGKENLLRLVKMKKAWDPNNIFAHNNYPLPSEYPLGHTREL
ncbi:putative FAD-binding domain-containing protein [Rosellinia necatrix]|uniref:Putative FAD-binding domain-containing protein n=1 Tax=Rosellinia necatrix TaxID=77044 RepID=A0A1W2TJS3_ROSNE|nr:putative FAD-binding domain-containing protein [Rosellinia necatrix]